jgi:HD-like signal output (HDOD) protein
MQLKKNLLFVDDQRQILKSINRIFIDTSYTIFFAENGEEALQVLDKEKIDMIISDMRMPGMDGYRLLSKVKEKHPLVLRLILSGYAQENLVFKAIQNNLAKSYLRKPWDNHMLIETINQIFEVEKIIRNKYIFEVINNLEETPTIPMLYQKLCSLIEQDVDMKTIINIIEEDPVIVAKILHIANSAFYGVRTGSINQAILYLGLINIKNIVLSTSVFSSLLMNSGLPNRDLLWKHSCMCNKMVSLFYEKLLGKSLPDTHMSAGLLHDIGKIALYNNFGEKYRNVIKIMDKHEGITIIEAEKEVISISHQEIGGYLLNWWDLPQPVIETSLFHHQPLDERVMNKELVCIVHIADYYSWEILGNDGFATLNIDTFEFLGISKESCEELASEVKM